MWLTLVRHACANRQNKFKVHVPHRRDSLSCYVRKYTALRSGDTRNLHARQKSRVAAPLCPLHFDCRSNLQESSSLIAISRGLLKAFAGVLHRRNDFSKGPE